MAALENQRVPDAPVKRFQRSRATLELTVAFHQRNPSREYGDCNMPVVGSSAYNTAGQITSLVRSLLNDAQGNLFTDAVLLPYANSAYRKVQRAIGNIGGGGFIQDDVLLVVTAVTQTDTSLQVALSDATAPPNQLPTDLLVPVKIWERVSGSSDDFVEMVDLSQHGGLPSRAQGRTLSVWEWRADGVYFLGATQDTQIRLRYLKAYPDLTDASSPVLVRNAQEAIAYATAALAGWSRGSPLSGKWDEAAGDAIEDLVAAAVRREQQSARRRRPFSARTGYIPF